MSEETTTNPDEEEQREDPEVEPEQGETAITDVGTPQEHASEVVAKREVATFGDPDPPPSREGVKRVLAFLNEVAGGRKLLTACRELSDAGADYFAVVAPQNLPIVGQLVDVEERRAAAQSRVDVTQSVLREFGIESEGAVMDPDSALALDDAVRATKPDYILLSCLYETRFGLTAQGPGRVGEGPLRRGVEHIPVRVDDDAVRWDLTHTLVVATQTVNSKDLVDRLKQRAKDKPHRYTFICPRSGAISREEVCSRLAATLAEMYRNEIDATGQPMSPDPFHAIQNAIEHYRIDDILISTLKGEQSKWLEEGLIEKVQGITDKPRRARRVRHRARRLHRGGDTGRRGSRGLMESASVAVGHAEEHHAHPPEANQSSRIDRQTLGILLFIVSEVMLFGAFFASYFFLRVVANDGPWPPDPFELPVAVAGMNTAILVSSSFTMHWALESIRRGNRRGLQMGLATTFLLGLTFLFIQINEYVHIGFSARDDAFGSIFYGLTGLHGAHVTVGLVLLGIANVRAWRGHYGPEAKDHLGVEVPGIYWHFVDVMWIIVFTTVYIL